VGSFWRVLFSRVRPKFAHKDIPDLTFSSKQALK
jgi:hypothetical protein